MGIARKISSRGKVESRLKASGTPRVLVLNPFAVLSDQPGITRHADLSRGISEFRFEVIASSFGSLLGGTSRSSDAYRVVPTPRYSSNGARRVLNWLVYFLGASTMGISSPRPDIVYASSPHLLSGLAGWFISRRWGAPLVVEVRDLWPKVLFEMGAVQPSSLMGRVLSHLEEFLYRKSSHIIVLTDGARAELVKRGFDYERISIIPNFSTMTPDLVSADRDQVREAVGFEGPTFIYMGSHGPANGLNLLLDALCGSIPGEFSVVLVGDGVDKESLRSRVEQERIPNVRFLPAVPKSRAPELLMAADFGLHILDEIPVFEFGVSPNKIFDYLALGLPIVTNVRGETAELVRGTGSGLAVPSWALLSAMRELVQLSDNERRGMTQAGIRYSSTVGSPQVRRQKLVALLNDVLTTDEAASPRFPV